MTIGAAPFSVFQPWAWAGSTPIVVQAAKATRRIRGFMCGPCWMVGVRNDDCYEQV
jgi:hypothetical protein